MKEKLMKVLAMANLFAMTMMTKVNAKAWEETGTVQGNSNTQVTSIVTVAGKFVKPFAIILIFASVVMVGFEIIMKRNKADERMESMSSLLWVGIGTLILAFALLIVNLVMTSVGTN